MWRGETLNYIMRNRAVHESIKRVGRERVHGLVLSCTENELIVHEFHNNIVVNMEITSFEKISST